MRAVTKSNRPIIFNIITGRSSAKYLNFANKKGFEFYLHWVELVFVILLVAGIFMANIIKTPAINFLVVFMAGFATGKVIHHHRKKDMLFPYILLAMGFIVGYVLGTSMNKTIILILFVIGNFLSIYISDKGMLG